MELRELLTCVTAPVAVDVHARSAVLSWSPPDPSNSRMGQHNFNAIDVAAVIRESRTLVRLVLFFIRISDPFINYIKDAHILVIFFPFEPVAELSYELYVSLAPGEKNNVGAREREKVRQVAAGKVREFRLEGLTPATDYQVAIQAVSDKVRL